MHLLCHARVTSDVTITIRYCHVRVPQREVGAALICLPRSDDASGSVREQDRHGQEGVMGMNVRFDPTRLGFGAGSPIAFDIGGHFGVTAKFHVISREVSFPGVGRVERNGSPRR